MPLFYQSIVMLLFLQMDVHSGCCARSANSYRYVPPGAAHLSNLFTMARFEDCG